MNNTEVGPQAVFLHLCRKANLKITPQRTIIYGSLVNDKSHPSADTVFRRVRKKIPNISFDTVNRTLLSFADAGILRVVESYGRPKRFDPDTGYHHHFQCFKCNAIFDFNYPDFDALKIPAYIKNKVTVTRKSAVLAGICGSCRT